MPHTCFARQVSHRQVGRRTDRMDPVARGWNSRPRAILCSCSIIAPGGTQREKSFSIACRVAVRTDHKGRTMSRLRPQDLFVSGWSINYDESWIRQGRRNGDRTVSETARADWKSVFQPKLGESA